MIAFPIVTKCYKKTTTYKEVVLVFRLCDFPTLSVTLKVQCCWILRTICTPAAT